MYFKQAKEILSLLKQQWLYSISDQSVQWVDITEHRLLKMLVWMQFYFQLQTVRGNCVISGLSLRAQSWGPGNCSIPPPPLYLFLFLFLGLLSWFILLVLLRIYYAFQKHANSKSSKAAFTIAFFAAVSHNYEYKQQTLKHRNTQNRSKSTNHQPWTFELVEVNVCFLRGPLRWLTAVKNANVSWVLNFRIPKFLKSAIIKSCQTS